MLISAQHSTASRMINRIGHSHSIWSKLAFWVLLLSVFAAIEPASAQTIRCDGCSPAAKRDVAKAAGEGSYVVYDLINNQATGFDVTRDDQSLGSYQASVSDVNPLIKNQVAAFSAFFAATGGSMVVSSAIDANDINLPGLGGSTAFDIAEDANLRSQLADSLWSAPPHGVNSALLWVIETIKAAGFTLAGITTSARMAVVFWDGSSVAFTVDLNLQQVSYIRGSARTGGGQLIPETNDPFEVAGTYRFNIPGSLDTDASRFLLHLAALGIPVVNSSSGPAGTVRCTFDGKTLTCRTYPN